MSIQTKNKWKNWWWYHKVQVLIAAAALGIVLYSVLPGLWTPKPDVQAAIVAADCPPELPQALRGRLEEILPDRNGDGRVLAEVRVFSVDLTGQGPGGTDYTEAAALDADLVGAVSAIFLLEDPAAFAVGTAVSVRETVPCAGLPVFEGLGVPPGWAFTVRSDADRELYDRILSYR